MVDAINGLEFNGITVSTSMTCSDHLRNRSSSDASGSPNSISTIPHHLPSHPRAKSLWIVGLEYDAFFFCENLLSLAGISALNGGILYIRYGSQPLAFPHPLQRFIPTTAAFADFDRCAYCGNYALHEFILVKTLAE